MKPTTTTTTGAPQPPQTGAPQPPRTGAPRDTTTTTTEAPQQPQTGAPQPPEQLTSTTTNRGTTTPTTTDKYLPCEQWRTVSTDLRQSRDGPRSRGSTNEIAGTFDAGMPALRRANNSSGSVTSSTVTEQQQLAEIAGTFDACLSAKVSTACCAEQPVRMHRLQRFVGYISNTVAWRSLGPNCKAAWRMDCSRC